MSNEKDIMETVDNMEWDIVKGMLYEIIDDKIDNLLNSRIAFSLIMGTEDEKKEIYLPNNEIFFSKLKDIPDEYEELAHLTSFGHTEHINIYNNNERVMSISGGENKLIISYQKRAI